MIFWLLQWPGPDLRRSLRVPILNHRRNQIDAQTKHPGPTQRRPHHCCWTAAPAPNCKGEESMSFVGSDGRPEGVVGDREHQIRRRRAAGPSGLPARRGRHHHQQQLLDGAHPAGAVRAGPANGDATLERRPRMRSRPATSSTRRPMWPAASRLLLCRDRRNRARCPIPGRWDERLASASGRNTPSLLVEMGVDLIQAEYVGFIEDCRTAIDACSQTGVPSVLSGRSAYPTGRNHAIRRALGRSGQRLWSGIPWERSC